MKTVSEKSNLKNVESEIQDDEIIIHDFEKFETGSFRQWKFCKSEQMLFIELEENEITEKYIEITITFLQEKVDNESDDEPNSATPISKRSK